MRSGGSAEGLADLAGGEATAVGDDVGGHGRAEAPVALVDVLDHALAPVAAGQIEVDVRPLAALLGEKALEEQLHADGIHGGDAERVAHRAVGRRAPPLHQDVLPAAILHEVPYDEEVAGEVEAGDEIQLARDLLPRALGELRVPLIAHAPAGLGEVAQVADGRLAGRQRIVGEAIAEVLEGEGETDGELPGIGHRLRTVGEEPLHVARTTEIALAVVGEEPPRAVQRGVVADAGERVQQRPLPALGQPRRVGGEQRQAERGRLPAQPLVAGLLGAVQVAL